MISIDEIEVKINNIKHCKIEVDKTGSHLYVFIKGEDVMFILNSGSIILRKGGSIARLINQEEFYAYIEIYMKILTLNDEIIEYRKSLNKGDSSIIKEIIRDNRISKVIN